MNHRRVMQLLRDRGFARTGEELESFAFKHPKGYIELAGIDEGAKEYQEFIRQCWNNRRQNNGMQNYGSL